MGAIMSVMYFIGLISVSDIMRAIVSKIPDRANKLAVRCSEK